MGIQVIVREIKTGLARVPVLGRFISNSVEDNLRKALTNQVATLIKKEMASLVSSWNTNIDFVAQYSPNDFGQLDVYPTGENADIWHYVSQGTPKHEISPVNYEFLLLPGSYLPHTTGSGSSLNVKGTGTRKPPYKKVYRAVYQSIKDGRDFEGYLADKLERKILIILNKNIIGTVTDLTVW